MILNLISMPLWGATEHENYPTYTSSREGGTWVIYVLNIANNVPDSIGTHPIFY